MRHPEQQYLDLMDAILTNGDRRIDRTGVGTLSIFGAIPFTDAMVVRYVDDRMRSRVSGIRIAVSFGVSSMAVWALGPIVKASGFQWLMLLMAGIAAVTLAFAMLLPDASQTSPGQAKPEAA